MSLNHDAVEERVRGARAGLWRLAGPWWLMLVTGLAWLIISVMVLRFRLSSITTVGVLIGVVFLLAMFNEFLLASVRAGWRWAHVLLGVLFAVGAIWAFANPINAFWALASVLGLLLIFEGTLTIISSAAARDVKQHLVARPGGWHSGDLARLLGLPANVSRPCGAPAVVGRVLRLVPRHLRSLSRSSSGAASTPSSTLGAPAREGRKCIAWCVPAIAGTAPARR